MSAQQSVRSRDPARIYRVKSVSQEQRVDTCLGSWGHPSAACHGCMGGMRGRVDRNHRFPAMGSDAHIARPWRRRIMGCVGVCGVKDTTIFKGRIGKGERLVRDTYLGAGDHVVPRLIHVNAGLKAVGPYLLLTVDEDVPCHTCAHQQCRMTAQHTERFLVYCLPAWAIIMWIKSSIAMRPKGCS